MLEELSEEEKESDILVGRCIHLDTDYTSGSNFDGVRLNHLDCAINLYTEESIKHRLEENLANGEKVTKAEPRIHLIRVEDVPFKKLIDIALLFFRSKSLTKEWISYQFKEIEK